MRAAIAFLLFAILAPVHAVEWRSEAFLCAANLPDGPGWQGIEAPPIPGITVLVAIRNPAKQALFGINVVEQLPSANLSDPAVRSIIESLLHQFTYQVVGHSSVKVGGLDWLHYPVRSGSGPQQASGVVRFTSANGHIFGITLLRGGGKDASQDVELQHAAASFRVLSFVPAGSVATATPPTPPPAEAAAPTSRPIQKKAPVTPSESAEPEAGYKRYIVPGVVGFVVLLVLLKIIGGSSAKPVKPPHRKR